jgi:hypothetical protein
MRHNIAAPLSGQAINANMLDLLQEAARQIAEATSRSNVSAKTDARFR